MEYFRRARGRRSAEGRAGVEEGSRLRSAVRSYGGQAGLTAQGPGPARLKAQRAGRSRPALCLYAEREPCGRPRAVSLFRSASAFPERRLGPVHRFLQRSSNARWSTSSSPRKAFCRGASGSRRRLRLRSAVRSYGGQAGLTAQGPGPARLKAQRAGRSRPALCLYAEREPCGRPPSREPISAPRAPSGTPPRPGPPIPSTQLEREMEYFVEPEEGVLPRGERE